MKSKMVAIVVFFLVLWSNGDMTPDDPRHHTINNLPCDRSRGYTYEHYGNTCLYTASVRRKTQGYASEFCKTIERGEKFNLIEILDSRSLPQICELGRHNGHFRTMYVGALKRPNEPIYEWKTAKKPLHYDMWDDNHPNSANPLHCVVLNLTNCRFFDATCNERIHGSMCQHRGAETPCEGKNTCKHTCVSSESTEWYCYCEPGYDFDPNNNTCISKDFCSANNGGCDHECTMSGDQKYCKCKNGYKKVNLTKCVDRNECEFINGGCDHRCINYDGGHKCKCLKGFEEIYGLCHMERAMVSQSYFMPALVRSINNAMGMIAGASFFSVFYKYIVDRSLVRRKKKTFNKVVDSLEDSSGTSSTSIATRRKREVSTESSTPPEERTFILGGKAYRHSQITKVTKDDVMKMIHGTDYQPKVENQPTPHPPPPTATEMEQRQYREQYGNLPEITWEDIQTHSKKSILDRFAPRDEYDTSL